MKNNKSNVVRMQSPIKLVIAILDRGDAKAIESYLSENNLDTGIVFMGKGTAETSFGDIFGFGIQDKDVIACIIPVNHEKDIIKDINRISGIEQDKFGLTFVIDIQSAGSNLLEALKIKVG